MNDNPLVQWSFLQYKKTAKNTISPTPCFLQSVTQIGSKLLYFGGCDYAGEALNQLLLYDTANYLWSSPQNSADLEEDHPGCRYGHTATLIEMHPPKILVYGGFVGGGTYEFEEPDSIDDTESSSLPRAFMSWRRKGQKSQLIEEVDDTVYFLTLNADKWNFTKPLVHGGKETKPSARAEHSACKTGANEVTVFGGWASRPLNDMWTFNFVDMEWRVTISSGIQPRPRYRHTAEVVGTKMYILGGSDNNEDIAEESRGLGIHELNLETMQWNHPTLNGYNPFPRSGHSSAVIGAKSILIFGGKKNPTTFLNDLILIDIENFIGIKINCFENSLPTPIGNSTLSVIGNKCFVFGGTDQKGNCYNDIRTVDIGSYLSPDDITVNEGASSDYCFKIIIIGDSAVGKSALLTRFSENSFLQNHSPTIGIDFNSRMIRVDNAICKLEIWDTAGQERFSTMTANYYRGAQGALLVYDISHRHSFEHVQNWFQRAKQLGGEDLIAILVGNKIDLHSARQVTTAEGETLALQIGVPFIETSALNGSNVEKAFVNMTKHIKKYIDSKGLRGVKAESIKTSGGVVLSQSERKNRSNCCN